MRIAALLNHYKLHHVPHVVPHLFALSIERPEWDIWILSASAEQEEFARDIGKRYSGHKVNFHRLRVRWWTKCCDQLLRNFTFFLKKRVFLQNRDLLCGFDALVVPEVTSLRRKGYLPDTRMIYCSHGSGDPYDKKFGLLNEASDDADMAVVVNYRMRDMALQLGRLKACSYGVSGYVKYEVANTAPRRFFDNDRPTVIYNPTQALHKTSWHRYGTQILEFFARSDQYNLIFAPHVVLFERRFGKGAAFPTKWRNCRAENILIDLGSRASVDMTYLNAADIYLGDQSSQIFEFIQRPRPAVFLNAHDADWRGNPAYLSWSFGPVVEPGGDFLTELQRALDIARQDFAEHFEPVQAEIAKRDCTQFDLPASTRGARIIAEYLESGTVSPRWQ